MPSAMPMRVVISLPSTKMARHRAAPSVLRNHRSASGLSYLERSMEPSIDRTFDRTFYLT